MKTILQPNCSEVCCRLPYKAGLDQARRLYGALDESNLDEKTNKELKGIIALNMYDEDHYIFYTDSTGPGEILDSLMSALGEWEEAKTPSDIPEIRWAGDGGGGGGDYDYVEKVYDLVRLWSTGHLTDEQIEYLDAILYDSGVEDCPKVDKEIDKAWGRESDTKSKL